jgi:thiamine-monophosphate kinase
MVISITAIGEAELENIVYRNGAKVNDLICVSGDLGAAYAGLQLLEREKMVFKANPEIQPDITNYEYIVQRQLKPEARKDIIEILKSLDVIPTSMIDISDGLSSELLHICEQSNCGCAIYEDKLPIADDTKEFSKEILIDATTFALNGGEDYELLFTVKQTDFEKVVKNPYISIIGYITSPENSSVIIARDGTEIQIQAQGWNPLKK